MVFDVALAAMKYKVKSMTTLVQGAELGSYFEVIILLLNLLYTCLQFSFAVIPTLILFFSSLCSLYTATKPLCY